jgi:diguanylate cyclase (GGDEF)-like protein
MELRHYLRMLQRGWWIIALTTLSGLALALYLAYVATPLYRATARFIVSPNVTFVDARSLIDSLTALDKRSIIATYAEVLDSNRIYNDTILSLQSAPKDLRVYTHSTIVLPDANILELAVQGPDPQVTSLLANSLGQRGIEYIKGLDKIYDINLLDPATVPTSPYSPQPLRDASLAAALGLVAGAVLAILSEQIRIPLDMLRQRSMIDSTSSIYTRRYFQRRIEEEIARNQTGILSLGLVRLDGLQDLFDTLPQAVLQRLLRRVVKILHNELRGNDILGRWDNISFAILLPATSGVAATRTLERIQLALSKPLEIDLSGETVRLAPQIGVVPRTDGESARALITRAETALDQAEQNGSLVLLVPNEK